MSVTSSARSPRRSVTSPGIPRRSASGPALRGRLDRAHQRLIACWRGAELDRQLATGISPGTTGVLTLRAQRITRRRSRTSLAAGLARALRSAERTTPGLTAALRAQASELVAARTVFAALDRRLRGSEPVSAQGVAILRALLTDSASTLYQPSEPGALASQLRTAAATLRPS